MLLNSRPQAVSIFIAKTYNLPSEEAVWRFFWAHNDNICFMFHI